MHAYNSLEAVRWIGVETAVKFVSNTASGLSAVIMTYRMFIQCNFISLEVIMRRGISVLPHAEHISGTLYLVVSTCDLVTLEALFPILVTFS